MKCYTLFLVICLAVSLARARPAEDDSKAETLRLETDNNGIDKYSFNYETSNGIARSEEGVLKPGTGDAEGVLAVSGSSSWTAPDGKKYEITFTADETGYHPIVKLAA
ncbi:endocuticle structural glycoprotein ABD-5 [Drosophila novamexicana]|uniref:endocuticle structural glycoprotein ABD-5 n=1 Tax=Drosophila novamexicana TaxID=47314 RepID=UPI0011E5DBC6|nr:endocuticle structural glycoprotein ABD-5 [Drosophila novamexicana]